MSLTNFDFSVTIICKKIPILEKEEKNKNMRGCVVGINFKSPQQSRIKYSCKQDYKMKELHANLKETANYLIQLFYATGQKYSCSRTKLGKLLSIVAFIYALEDEELFDESIYRYDGCGTAINELKSYFDRDIYIQFGYEDDQEFIEEDFDFNIVPKEKYTEITTIEQSLRANIERVFRNFGSYKASELGKCINPIVNHAEVTKEDEVNLCAIHSLCRADFLDVEDHKELIDFLFGTLEIDDAE